MSSRAATWATAPFRVEPAEFSSQHLQIDAISAELTASAGGVPLLAMLQLLIWESKWKTYRYVEAVWEAARSARSTKTGGRGEAC